MRLSNHNPHSKNRLAHRFAGHWFGFALRAALIASIAIAGLITPAGHSAQVQESCVPACGRDTRPGCFASRKTDIVFIVDSSRSIGQRGQTYNISLEGIQRVLLDPAIVARDGSIAIAVETFNRRADINVPLTEINSSADAASLASAIEKLKCANIGSSALPCPADDTDYDAAISVASSHISQARPAGSPRYNSRRIMVLISDGTPDIPEFGIQEAVKARNKAATDGVALELDAVLVGVQTGAPEFNSDKANLDQLLFRIPANAGQAETLVINAGDCSLPGATFSGADCDRQANEFASGIRNLIRSDIAALSLVVNTDSDSPVDNSDTALTLRQAIDRANCNGGNAVITFAESVRGKTISPLTPLPALTQPEITIDGCVGDDCTPAVTIDGASTDTAKGEAHCDGILIRSDHDTVRGVRIINFKRAGVALTPCAFDSFGNNLVERNVLENNAVAGVLVCDPPAVIQGPAVKKRSAGEGLSTEALTPAVHNEGNMISRNRITGSATLIDLGCTDSTKGPTANDAGDADAGPNTLLNFPNQMSVASEGSTVKVTGQVTGPTAPGSTVEIFAVTNFTIQNERVVITGVSFLAQATADEMGNFMATGVAASPTGIYTATVTDRFMNTSELMADFPQDLKLPQPHAVVTVGTPIGNIAVNDQPRQQKIEVTNTGTAPLVVNCAALVASCTAQTPGTPDPRFVVTGCPTAPINPTTGPNDQINKATITITFTPSPAGFTGTVCGPTSVCFRLNTNDPAQQQISTTVAANVTGTTQPIVSATQLTFKKVNPGARKIRTATFTVENNGCQDLIVSFGSILRQGNDVSDNRRDDSRFFSVTVSNPSGADTAFGPGNSVTIARGANNRRTFTVRFNPVIPAVSNCKSQAPLAASDVLPDVLTSLLTLNHNGGGTGQINITLNARVRGIARLINPNDPTRDPLVTLASSGNDFTVDFSIFDSDLTVSTATFEFLTSSGAIVGQPITVGLRDSLPGCLAHGQSFSVTQRFTGAASNRNVAQVRVTISDGETTDTATSNAITSASIKRAKR